MPIHKVDGGYQWGGRGKVYATRAQAARQARAAYANGYVGKSRSLVEIRKTMLNKSLSRDDRKSLATGVGGASTAAGLGGAGVFIVRERGHSKLLRNQIASEKMFAGTKTTPVNHYRRGEGAGKIAPEQHILRHLKRGKAATLGLAAGGTALTAYGLRRRPVEKSDRRRSADIAAMGGGATVAGGGYGLARVLESQGNKWADRAAQKIEEAQKIAPELGGWHKGKTRTRVRHVQPDISNKNINRRMLRRLSPAKIEEVAALRGAAGQHRHFGKIYGDIGRQFRRYAVPAGAAIGAAGAGDMALRRSRERLAKAMSEDRKKGTATGVGAVGIGAGLVGGGIPGVRADASAGERLFPHLPKYQKPKPKDLLHPGPVRPRLKAAAQMGRGGIFGYRTDAHQRFLDRQVADDIKYGGTQTTRGNHFLRGQGTGKIAPEQKIIRHMKAGRKASYGLLAGGTGLVAYGHHKKKPVEKSDDERRHASQVATGGSIAGGGYGAARLLEHQGRRWAKQSARDIEAAQKIAPMLGGWSEGSRHKGSKHVPNIKPDVSNKQAEVRRRNIFATHTRAQAEEAGRLRGRAAQGRYFSGVYGSNAKRIRRLAIPAGLAVAASGGVGMARDRRREVGKAYQPSYFQGSIPTERLHGQRQRTVAEGQRAALTGTAGALTGASGAALGARWLGHKHAPAVIQGAGAYARTKGVPKETVKDLSARAERVHQWAKPRRGRLLAASAVAAGGATAARIGARWKKSEIEGISQDLGRASSGDRLQRGSKRFGKSLTTAVAAEYGMKAARKWGELSPKTRSNIIRGSLIGTAGAAGGGTFVASSARGNRWHQEHKKLRAAGGVSGPVMKSESAGHGVSKRTNLKDYDYLPENIREDVGYGSIGIRRNPMSALDLFASSRLLAEAEANARGERVSRSRLNRRAINEANYAGARAMLYSPTGRGSVF